MTLDKISKYEYYEPRAYAQYTESVAIEHFFEALNEEILYYKALVVEAIEQVKLRDSDSPRSELAPFYYRYYFGLERILGAAAFSTFFDTEEKYDDTDPQLNITLIYDGPQNQNGFIDADAWTRLLRFMLDYNMQVWSIPTLTKLFEYYTHPVLDTAFDATKFRFIPEINNLRVETEANERYRELIRIVTADANALHLPYGVTYDFRFKTP